MGEGGVAAAVWVSRRVPLASEVREVGGDVNRWLLTKPARMNPTRKTLRIWKRTRKWGKLAGCPWRELVLVLLLLGVLHLINDSVQDGLSCWNLLHLATPALSCS